MSQVIEAPAPLTASELLAGWCTWMEISRNHAPNTIKLYRRVVEIFSESFDLLSEDVTEEAIQAWVQQRGGSSSTVSNRISGLASFYRYAKKMKLRLDNPVTDLDRPKRTKNLPKPVEDLEQVLMLLDEADRRANEVGSIPRRVGETRDMAVFLCQTGLRIHEAVACDWPVPCPPQMKIRGKGRKDAILPVTDKAREAWDRLGGRWPIGARATQRRFERAGITPHMCRHWLGSTMAANGRDLGDIKAALRHENMQTTLGYAAWGTDRVRAAMEGL
jgi:site-specific recombinase XerD